MIIKFGVFMDSINQYFKNNCFLFHGQNFGKVDYALNYVLTSKKKETGDFEIIHIYTEELKKGDFYKYRMKQLSLIFLVFQKFTSSL